MLQQAQQDIDELIALRRHFHQQPEIGYKEFETSRYIKEKLIQFGVEILDLGLETGVVGLIKGAKPGPTVALRADIDALPIKEANEVAYKSQHEGIMHACGHDVHTTCLLGAAKLLAAQRKTLCGAVKLLFQPAEELNGGANLLVDKGALADVTAIFGLHNSPEIPVGQVGLKSGPLMAATDRILITVTGQQGHGAQPQTARDPVVATAAIIQALQTIVSRNVSPLETAVVSCCSIHGGHAYNVIPEKVEVLGTVRTFNPAVRELMPKRIEALAGRIAEGFGVAAKLDYYRDLPALINPEDLTAFCRESVAKVFGKENVICPTPSMGGEDFAIYQQQVPGVFFFLGVGNKEKGINKPWHNAQFNVDEQGLAYGAAMLAQLAQDYLKNKQH